MRGDAFLRWLRRCIEHIDAAILWPCAPRVNQSDLDRYRDCARSQLIWHINNWRACFEQQQARAIRAEAELARLRATPEAPK